MKKTEKNNKRSYEGLLAVLLLSVVLIGVGAVMWFSPEIQFANFCRGLGAILVVFGLVRIIRYLMRAEYRNVTNYDFTIGLILASLGVCLIASAARFGESGVQFMGVLVLVDAIISLQYALQIRFMDGRLFPLALMLAIATYVFGMLAIIEPRNLFHRYMSTFSLLVAISGVFGLISLLLAWTRTKTLVKEEERDARRILEEDPAAVKKATEVEEAARDTGFSGNSTTDTLSENAVLADITINESVSDPPQEMPETENAEDVAKGDATMDVLSAMTAKSEYTEEN